MNDLRTDLEALKREWHDTVQTTTGWEDVPPQWQVAIEVMDEKLTAILAEHPAGPDLRKALERLSSAAKRATRLRKTNETGAPDMGELCMAIVQADAALAAATEPKAGEATVEWAEGSDGEWTCSGCGRDWYIEAETPKANEYLHCPGCGKRIAGYKKYDPCDDDDDERRKGD